MVNYDPTYHRQVLPMPPCSAAYRSRLERSSPARSPVCIRNTRFTIATRAAICAFHGDIAGVRVVCMQCFLPIDACHCIPPAVPWSGVIIRSDARRTRLMRQHFPGRSILQMLHDACGLRCVNHRVKVVASMFPVARINGGNSRNTPGNSSVNACCHCEQGKSHARVYAADRDARFRTDALTGAGPNTDDNTMRRFPVCMTGSTSQ
jgi:hypothetical protein